jgi:hypothetical protein
LEWTRRGLHSPVAKIWPPIFKVNAGAEENMALWQHLYIDTIPQYFTKIIAIITIPITRALALRITGVALANHHLLIKFEPSLHENLTRNV